MKILMSILASLVLLTLAVSPVMAIGLEWIDHASPYDFFFDNHIDTHLQAKILRGGKLLGFLYIRFTGEITESGIHIAKHADCNQVQDECIPGWVLHGLPIQATLFEHQPDQHPQWCVDPVDMPDQLGFTHFHWLGQPEHAGELVIGQTYDGYLLRLTTLETFFFDHHGGFLVTPGIDYEQSGFPAPII